MEFSLSPEQQMFWESVLEFSREHLAPLAEEADLHSTFSWEAWRTLGAFGLRSLNFPQA